MATENDNNAMRHDGEKSCWNCRYQDITRQDTFLGICTWFSKQGKKDKPIPPDIVDVGCDFFEPR